MTAAVLTQLPLAAGSALASGAGKAALWGLSRYARAPLSNTAILALAGFSVLAASNALYFQSHRHPAPLFGVHDEQVAELAPVPAAPVVRHSKSLPKVPAVQTTGSVTAKPAPAQPIGNADVFDLQRKLQAIGMFEGTVDGLYGPKTARAIRKFEEQQGLKPRGQLTREIITAILGAPAAAPQPVAPLKATPAPEPVVESEPATAETPILPMSNPEPATAEAPQAEPNATLEALPAPAPLQPRIETASTGSAPARHVVPAAPKQALAIAPAPDAEEDLGSDAAAAVVAAVDDERGEEPLEQPMPPKVQATAPTQRLVQPAAQPVGEGDAVASIVTEQMPTVATAPITPRESKDPSLVAKVQRGLASLGFLSGLANGKASEATAKAIRNFEVWNNYDVTGRITPQLLDLLVAAGADI